MQHHIIIAEMRDGTFLNVSRDCQSKQHTLQLLAVLNREFIAKRPPEGWSAFFKKRDGGGGTNDGGGPANTPV